MPAPVTTQSIWNALSKHAFAVLSWTATDGSSRSAGIVYVVRDRRLLIGADTTSWKARQIGANPAVSMTATFPRRMLLMPWIQIPDATITLRGKARIIAAADVDPGVARDLTRGMVDDPERLKQMCVIEVTPEGEFLTYGIDVSTMAMGDPHKASGRAPVS